MSTELALPLVPPSSPGSTEQYANSRKIAEQIAILLNLFWTSSEPQAVRDAAMKAWLEDLREFPVEVVAAACREYRRNHTKRPHIADIRQLCVGRKSSDSANLVVNGLTHEEWLKGLQARHTKPKLRDDIIRENWRDLPVREWTKFELETANLEMTALAHKYGFNSGDDRQDRVDYNAAVLAARVPCYDVKTGREGKIIDYWLSNALTPARDRTPEQSLADIPVAPEIPADSVHAAVEAGGDFL